MFFYNNCYINFDIILSDNSISMKRIIEKFIDYITNLKNELKVFYYLFKKENVFRYFLIIFFLMIISGILFIFLEYDQLIAANGNNNLSFFNKIITAMYWAIVTIATCGYGDITPSTPAGRILVIIVLYLSVAAVSLFTANLASALTTKKMMERRGIMNLGELKDHFIICGWKNSMNQILSEILFHNPKLNLKKIIIIANVEPDTIELFYQQYPEFQQIIILRGEHYNETLLKKANIQKANKVLILADESTPSSPTEVDSKSVMTAMTIYSISNNIKVSAELLDIKFEKYLKSAHVEEIIYTNEYNKVLIANSFTQIGITKIINNLLNANMPGYIATEKIPHSYVGKCFSDLRNYFKDHKNSILIGLLENVGGYIQRKKEAIREAQKTADVKKLINNLKAAKNMENNLPNINPDDSYIIPFNSMAVLIEREKNL